MAKPPISAQRKADFREIAREIQAASINPGQAIAAALERAYKRGWVEAHEGEPVEPDSTRALPWTQIPPRPRAAFNRVCLWARAYSSGSHKKADSFTAQSAADYLMLMRFSGGRVTREEWRVYLRPTGKGDWSFQEAYGPTTINPLIRLGLLDASPGADYEEATVTGVASISDYGVATWTAELQRSQDADQRF